MLPVVEFQDLQVGDNLRRHATSRTSLVTSLIQIRNGADSCQGTLNDNWLAQRSVHYSDPDTEPDRGG